VKLKNISSSWVNTKKGIPQGSCLGPLLFNVFTNDIFPHITKCHIFNYADDNSLSISGEKLVNTIKYLVEDTNIAITWFNDNFMKVNPEKFQTMIMCPPNNGDMIPTEIILNDSCSLEPSFDVKLLGVNIDSKLTFDNHVQTICKKASRQLKVLLRFKNLLGKNERELLFNTFILSCFNFCPVVWNFCGKSSLKLIEKIQERALGFVVNDYKSTYDELLTMTGRCTMHVARLRIFAIEVFKCVNKINPKFLNDVIIRKEMTIELRDPQILYVPKFSKVKYGKRTFSYFGPHIWNQLPSSFKRDDVDMVVFKKLILTWNGPYCVCNCCSLN